MMTHMDNNEFYDGVDALCVHLRQIGLDADANRIGHLLHKVAWTSTSELFRALESAFEGLLSGANATKLPQQTRDELNNYLQMLGNV
jgi:hypothetical protein